MAPLGLPGRDATADAMLLWGIDPRYECLLTQALNLPHDKVDVRLDLIDFVLRAEDSINCPLHNHGNQHDTEQWLQRT
jgi:hypothetical protein